MSDVYVLLLCTSVAIQVDKDVAVAKEHFGLQAPYDAMSPLVLYKGYTKDFLDGKVRCTRQNSSPIRPVVY